MPCIKVITRMTAVIVIQPFITHVLAQYRKVNCSDCTVTQKCISIQSTEEKTCEEIPRTNHMRCYNR